MSRYKNLWRDIIEAISGTDQDFSSGSLKRAILLLSIPMVLEMFMESIFAVVDIFFVSKLGADAIAVVGITESMMTIIYALSLGLGVGATAMISRKIGEKKPYEASEAAIQAILVAVTVSLAIAIPGRLFAKDLLQLMGASPSAIESGWKYTAWMIGGNTVITLLFVINAIFRSAGDAAISMRVLWAANIINIILDPCLIYGWGPFPAYGVEGAAIATNIGRGFAVVLQLYFLFNNKHRIKISFGRIRPKLTLMLKLIKLSLGAIAQNLIATSSWIGLVAIMAQFGSNVVAGYTLSVRVLIFALLPAWGISNAASTLVGQSLGAQNPERAEKAVWFTGMVNAILMGIIGLILVLNPGFFIGIFTDNSVIIQYGAMALRTISYGFLCYSFGMVIVQAINGAGDTYTPTAINFVCFWLIEIPLAYFLVYKLNMKDMGVYWAIVIAESLIAITGTIIFMQGKWKLKKI
jgi:putative MATE family efflux protein